MLNTIDRVVNTVQDFSSPNQFNAWLMQVGVDATADNIPKLCVTANSVRGCSTNVWISSNRKDALETWSFNFYSDTTMTNGIGSILTSAFNGLTTEQVNDVSFSDFNFLATHLTLAKKKGLQSMINHIKRIVNT